MNRVECPVCHQIAVYAFDPRGTESASRCQACGHIVERWPKPAPVSSVAERARVLEAIVEKQRIREASPL